jgi:uracil-DNA glycosylase family 4
MSKQKVFWEESEMIFPSEEKRDKYIDKKRELFPFLSLDLAKSLPKGKIRAMERMLRPEEDQDGIKSEVKRKPKLKLEKIDIFPCTNCPVDGEPVPPEGVSEGVVCVGMCPGAEENVQGRPFVGRSGELLREALKEAGFVSEELYFTNVVKCRLTDDKGYNRNPTPKEMKHCGRLLLEEIRQVNPKLIILLGDTALKYFFNRGPVSKYRGMSLSKGDFKFFVTYHPAYLLRNRDPEDKRLWKKDFVSAFRLVKGIREEEKDTVRVICNNQEDVDRWLNKILQESDSYILDIESWAPGRSKTGKKDKKSLDPWAVGFNILTISFSFVSSRSHRNIAVCIPLGHPKSFLSLEATTASLKIFFEECKTKNLKVKGQNIKWDLKVLEKVFGFKIVASFDTMLGHALTVGKRSGHSLERMSIDYLGVDSYKEELRQQIDGNEIGDLDRLAYMNMGDCLYTGRLAVIFEDKLRKIAEEQISQNKEWNIWKYHNEILMPGMQILKKMELRGMPVNIEYVHDLKFGLEKEIARIKEQIFSYPEMAQWGGLALTSVYDMNKILYEIFKFDPPERKTVAGYAVDKEVLSSLLRKYQRSILFDIQEYKTLTKIYSTYVLPYLDEYVKPDGRVHGSFNLHISVTGRLSMENPNLQNLPVRIGSLILRMFEAREGWQFLVADYSQIELRVMAAYSKDPRMMEAFSHDEDIHTLTAADIYGISLDQVTPEQRQDAKTINFGIIYGMQDEGLQAALNMRRGLDNRISLEEARTKREAYLNLYHGVSDYMAARKAEYKKYGYVETLFGRRSYISGPDEGHNERRAINTPIQGTASDINQKSLIEVDKVIESEGYRMGAEDVIHDAQVYEVPEDELEKAKVLIPEIMENQNLGFMNGVPLKVKISFGKDLGSAKG